MPPENDTTQTAQQSSGEQSQSTQAGNEGQGGGSLNTATTTRPDYVPETLWDPTTSAPKPEFGTTVHEALALKAAHEARLAARPEKPEGYALQFSQEFKLPEGLNLAFDEADPRVAMVRQFAHDQNLDQAGFSRLLEVEAKRVIDEQNAIKTAVDAEKKKLGANGTARIDELRGRLTAVVGDKRAGNLMDRLVLADDVAAMEDIMRAVSSQGAANFTQGGREPPGEKKPTQEQYATWSYHEQREFTKTGKWPERSAAA